MRQHLILALMWIVFCVLHSFFAGLWWKKKMESLMKGRFRFYRLFYTVFAFVSFGWVIAYQLSIPSPTVFSPHFLTTIAGAVIGLTGVLIMAVCIKKYFFQLSGLKSLYLNDDAAANELIITGIHRYVRHPLYSGTFLFIWGLWLLFPSLSLLIADVIITLYTILGIYWEEQKLELEFGDSYRRYKQKVPKLIPSFKHNIA